MEASAAKPPSGRKMKARAPPPPGKPALSVLVEQKPLRDATLGSQQNLTHMKEALRNSTLDITVVLPSGLEKQSMVNGSYAVMDLLVELCLQNHLNPSHHALEIWSSENQQPLSFTPNTLVGTLNVHTVFLKEKLPEEKAKLGPPKVPEKTVRLVVNYLRTQKAVVRVSPEVPLQNILPVICAKCEVSPDHVVLLRDNAAGEELELSKSLNELGIKELYVWDNRRETFRKSSLGNDETDKEKKKFLGFFKVNKKSNSKAEQVGQLGIDSDEEATKPAPGRSVNGCLTTPNSPSLRSRSLTLGPSLSLGNISGMSVKSEKKRRAPPPPSPGPSVQDKSSEKVSLSSQADLQKKKRRAPAPPPPQPPPPSPLVPRRREDQEEKRKSTVGGGRQVPQKPPRCTRGPPQLVLPPPPPYPPPDGDVAEPLSLPEEGTGLEAAEPRPKLNLPLGPGGHCGRDGVPPVPPEAEETVSVSSCFASEDTTEDSGVMSSPSDIISLDSQHDSLKSKDRWATDQEDCSDQDLVGTPELEPQKSPLWERNGSEGGHRRSEKVTRTANIDDDLFVTGQFHRTLAELNEDLEETEENYETDTSSVNGMPSCGAPDASIPNSDAETIPVTFIGEVLDDPEDPGLFSNRNNNASSFDLGRVDSSQSHLALIHAGHSQPRVRTEKEAPNLRTISHDVREGIQVLSSSISKDGRYTEERPKATSFDSKPHTGDLSTKAKDQAPSPAYGDQIQARRGANLQPASEKEGKETDGVPTVPAWCQRGQPTTGSYGLKYGLTTYKIVPPKSEMRYYDRGVSLSTGAIKIDELGNLVNPHANHRRTISLSSSSVVEAESQPIGKVKAFWRCGSMEKQLDQPMESSARQTPYAAPVATSVPSEPQEDGPKGVTKEMVTLQKAGPDIRSKLDISQTQQQARHWTHSEEEGGRPPSAATRPQKVPATHSTEATFLKPQRRTSSQYVASAIAKRIGPPKVHTEAVRQSDKAQEGTKVRAAAQPLAVKDDRHPEPHPEVPGHQHGAKQPPCISLPSGPGGETATGASLRAEDSSLPGNFSTQDCPATLRNYHHPLVRADQKGHVSVEQGCGSNKEQSGRNLKTGSASDSMHTLDRARPPSLLQSTSRVNGWAWTPGSREPPPSSPRIPRAHSHIILETGQKPPESSSADVHETDGTLPSSIFGPKKKFKPVVQRPVPKDTSLHSALMEAIHSAGGKDSLRKTAEHSWEEGPKRPSYTEAESERSALLAAIRGHSGAHSLRKVSSSASEELRGFRDAALQAPGSENPQQEHPGLLPPPPPAPPATQPLLASRAAARSSQGAVSNNNPVDARQALMDAIRSGTGAARLRKVPLLV